MCFVMCFQSMTLYLPETFINISTKLSQSQSTGRKWNPNESTNATMEQKSGEIKGKGGGKNINKKDGRHGHGVNSLVHSPSLYQGKIYRLFPRTNSYRCQTVQREASSWCRGMLVCFRCKHKTTVIYDVKLLRATYHSEGIVGCGLNAWVLLHVALRRTKKHLEVGFLS